MVDFVNKLELTNGNVSDENYKGKLLFPMKYFVSLITDLQSMYFTSAILLKDKIDGFFVPQFQLS